MAVSTDLASPVAGLRSLLMQALHPLAMAGVDQHSGWRRDPVGRLAATSAYVATVGFGERAAAQQAAARVRRIHEHVKGVDTVTGRPYGGRRIPRCCCGCTRPWSIPPPSPRGCSGRRYHRMMAIATWLRWPSRPSLSACPARWSPPASPSLTPVRQLGPDGPPLHAGGDRIDDLPARSARPRLRHRGSGRTSGTARSPPCRPGRRRCTAMSRRMF